MLKKITVLAMAVGVVAAIALPVSASASWKHHVTPIQIDKIIGLTGNVKFEGGKGGIECQVTSQVKFTAGTTTGHAETFVPHPTNETTNCRGLGGLALCSQVHDVTPQTPNWVFHTIQPPGSTGKIQLTTGNITSQTTGGIFCTVKHVELTPSTVAGYEVTLIPNQPNTVTSLQVHGKLRAHIKTNNDVVHSEDVQVGGSLEIEPPDRHTYSI